MAEYSREMLAALYELGRLYFESGYFLPAERIFVGLSAIDRGMTPARVGLGLIRLEKGQSQEAIPHLRAGLQAGFYIPESKVGLALSFISLGEKQRAYSLLLELAREPAMNENRELRALYEAAMLRCSDG